MNEDEKDLIAAACLTVVTIFVAGLALGILLTHCGVQ